MFNRLGRVAGISSSIVAAVVLALASPPAEAGRSRHRAHKSSRHASVARGKAQAKQLADERRTRARARTHQPTSR